MSRTTVTGGIVGVEYWSTNVSPSGASQTTWFALSGVRSWTSPPSRPARYRYMK